MNFDEYQSLARRTQNAGLSDSDKTFHAITGLASEVGEVMSLFQHSVQESSPLDKLKLKKEMGDIMWFMAELCDCYDWSLDNICALNIEKLRRRYPDGFDTERSVNRTDR